MPDYSLRSKAAMTGLLGAEMGDSMVKLDSTSGDCSTSRYKDGQRIDLKQLTLPMNPSNGEVNQEVNPLARHGTLLSASAPSGRYAAELNSLLGNSGAKLRSGASVLPHAGAMTHYCPLTTLEQAKKRARVEIDVTLESDICVEGNNLNGRIQVRVHRNSTTESAIMLAGGKLRLIGFESMSDHHQRHLFYRRSSFLANIAPNSNMMCESHPDSEGFALAREGDFSFPFCMHVPIDGELGKPKGMTRMHPRAGIRYIVMASIRLKDSLTERISIAHFYRYCEVWPRLNPSVILAPALAPLRATTSKSIFMGGRGRVELSATVHRLHWIAGQQCFVKVSVKNDTKRTIKGVNVVLVRSVVLFRPDSKLDAGPERLDDVVDSDACQTSTVQKGVACARLDMGHRGTPGHASAKGWWTGVLPGEQRSFSLSILIPPDALTIARSRFIEVEYTLRISLNAGAMTSDIHVTLPIRIINFLSLDPPPSLPSSLQNSAASGKSDPGPALQMSKTVDSLPYPNVAEDKYDDQKTYYQRPSSRSSHELYSDDCPSPCSSEDDHELSGVDQGHGHLDIEDDCDEVVQHAINSAKIDAVYGDNAGSFSDLFYSSDLAGLSAENEPEQEETSIQNISNMKPYPQVSPSQLLRNIVPDNQPNQPLGSIPAHSRSPSNFAFRVQEKIQAMVRKDGSSEAEFHQRSTESDTHPEPRTHLSKNSIEIKTDKTTGSNFELLGAGPSENQELALCDLETKDCAQSSKSEPSSNNNCLRNSAMPLRMDARTNSMRLRRTGTNSNARSSWESLSPGSPQGASGSNIEPRRADVSRTPRTPGGNTGLANRADIDMGPRGIASSTARGVAESPVKAKIRELEERLKAGR